MSNALKFVPPRVALTDPRTGLISREWFLFFQGVFDRIGGSEGPSNTDNAVSAFEDAGSSETNAMLFKFEDNVNQRPQLDQPIPVYDTLLAEVSELRERVTVLETEVQALKQSTFL